MMKRAAEASRYRLLDIFEGEWVWASGPFLEASEPKRLLAANRNQTWRGWGRRAACRAAEG